MNPYLQALLQRLYEQQQAPPMRAPDPLHQYFRPETMAPQPPGYGPLGPTAQGLAASQPAGYGPLGPTPPANSNDPLMMLLRYLGLGR